MEVANNDDVMSLDEMNEEILMCARYGEEEELTELIAYGASVSYCDPDSGNTALHYAAANGELGCMKILLEKGSSHVVNKQGNYPIHWAAENGKAEALKLLFNHFKESINVLEQNEFGRSTLTEAFTSKDLDSIEICLTHPSASEEDLLRTTPNASAKSQALAGHKVPTNSENEMEVDQSEQHAITHTMSLVPDNPTLIKIRELPITRADNPFGTEVAPEDDSTGLAIWPASIILARWVAENSQLTKDKVVVELGAGCGLPGLSAAVYGGARSVYLTDIHEPSLSNAVFNARLNLSSEEDNHVFKLSSKDSFSPFIDEVSFLSSKFENSLNIQSEKINVVRTANVSWQDKSTYPPEAADVILGSDLVYDSNILSLLIPAISGMLLPGGSFLYVAPDTGRDGMDGLHDALLAANFECLIRASCPADLYANPLVNTGDNDPYDMFILHFYDMSIKKPHTLFQYRKIN